MNIPPLIRQKRKPPMAARCDAMIGCDSQGHAPTLLRCPELATVEMKGGGLPFETWLCESCAMALEAKAEERR